MTDGPGGFDSNDVYTLIGDAVTAVNLLTPRRLRWLHRRTSSADRHPNDELIQRFYGAFARHDGDAMAACYAPDAHFSDPVFTDLRGEEPGAMWRMLTGRAEDLEVRLAEHEADDEHGSAHWLADYTFRTGRKVHNDIQAEFRFEDGLIAEHRDSFSFYAWSRQALGPDRPGARLDADRPGKVAARRAPGSTSSWAARPPAARVQAFMRRAPVCSHAAWAGNASMASARSG